MREAALERDLGVRHEYRHGGTVREVAGVGDDVCRLFSTRRAQVEGRVAEMVGAYAERHGAAPSGWVTAQMSQWATLETRRPKRRGRDRAETTAQALTRWEAETRANLDTSLRAVWSSAMAAGRERPAGDEPSDAEALAGAIAAVDAARSTWTRYDLARELTRALPRDPLLDAAGELARVDALVGAALDPALEGARGQGGVGLSVVGLGAPAVFHVPPSLRRHGDGGSVYDQHGAERYSTDASLAAEARLVAAARSRGGPRVGAQLAEAAIAAAGLAGDQAGAARQVLTSGHPLEALVGPAGTGKTYTMRAVAEAWRAGGGDVVGLAVSEGAARVLGEGAGIRAHNTAKMLFEHTHRDAAQRARAASA